MCLSDTRTERVVLPDTVLPSHYKLHLTPDLDRQTYQGTVAISVTVAHETDTVTVHAKQLSFTAARWASGSNGGEVEQISYNLKETTATLVFGSPLPAGEAEITIEFTGILNGDMNGFYRGIYTDVEGVKRVMASTQFEATVARRCFPCWDEPMRKAVFEVTMTVPANRSALSNMPEVESTHLPGGLKQVQFAPTPKMSTYALAFAVGEFDFVQAVTKHGVVIRCFAPPGKSRQGLFALDTAVKALDIYDDYFGIPYPLPKLDMMAVPEFMAGAMENWGLVIYREEYLLIDEAKASAAQRQLVAIVVAHELAHMWFGNLVTMEWWDDLWLNEGFASFMEEFVTNQIFPDWDIWGQYTIDVQQSALNLDALRTSHPIQVPIRHSSEVDEIFDRISYEKGSSVIRMVHAVLGAATFQAGLASYFARHSYGNTVTRDLWQAWEEASGKPIDKMMSSWTTQMGFPLVTVDDAHWVEGEGWVLKISQKWFLADGCQVDESEKKLWTVPLLYSTRAANGEPTLHIFDTETVTIRVPTTSASDWVKLNVGQDVPMRVLYPAPMLQNLQTAIRNKELGESDRAALILDAFSLAKNGNMDMAEVASLLTAYSREDTYVVWKSIESVLEDLGEVMERLEGVYDEYCAFVAALIRVPAAVCGWNNRAEDGHLSKRLRAVFVGLLCTYTAHRDNAYAGWLSWVQAEVRSRFDNYCKDPQTSVLPSEYKVPVYRAVAKSGGQSEYDALLRLYKSAEEDIERKYVMLAMGSIPDAAIQRKIMAWAMSEEVKLQDMMYPFMGVAASGKDGQHLAWHYYKDHFPEIKRLLENAHVSMMESIIDACAGNFFAAPMADEVEDFFTAHPLPGAQRKVAQVIEGTRINADILNRAQRSRLAQGAFWEELIGHC